ncbi:hypothetical protein EZV61_12340 [Corallincola luteus]|uniref:Tetratricopeptide repeat protein n=1 Tax=Corallincola luteus TaxID=1775177 RepID=A0ABY2AIP6_9GAMM|nr:hypothetical protein [Corallincola luteus]TCI02586.1 hypothetical protein EZV61_12340 [Corallincola luteus]
MRIFDIFKNRDRDPKGLIEYFSLQDWWLNKLSDSERKTILEIYQPMGGSGLIDGNIQSTTQTDVGLLSGMVGWFSKAENRHISYKLIEQAESLITAETSPLDIHFLYGAKIEITYKDRDLSSAGLDIAVRACEQQISVAEASAKEFLRQYKDSPLPSHKGFTQLAIVLEKKKDFSQAIDLAKKAKKQGWAGDWDKRIERCSKKIA